MIKVKEIVQENDIYICNSLYNNLEKLIKFKNDNKNCIFIVNGNVCAQGNDHEKINSDIEYLKNDKNIHYILSDNDLIYLKDQIINNFNFNQNLNWLEQQNYCIKIRLKNQSVFNVVCGGIKESLDSIENCFINIDWHKKYNGIYGMIISNYPENNQRKIYQYSCSIGISSKQLLIQKVSLKGLDNFILL